MNKELEAKLAETAGIKEHKFLGLRMSCRVCNDGWVSAMVNPKCIPPYTSFPEGLGLIFRDLMPNLPAMYEISIYDIDRLGKPVWMVELNKRRTKEVIARQEAESSELPLKLCEVIAGVLCNVTIP